ncbi:zinc-binding alcohol dehydrogenase family protein [Ancylobacter sp. Lp-2]|uniref:zinc-binding alcohol dehydrogenase family protein n=1 Tax=Ancylobacter sp. Lp-2 TaxID=2881339 RepID=UPI001E3493F5|nr:zinc-binding alcohol dehydrogenase family protein [Ancylobacter sp. Lp-2]MCB4768609.1 zinc-binding alcohol dehydrogenase family protein [Ancylobacter sp. Lp-2]
MKAIGYQQPGPIDRESALVDIELERPKATGRDLLVEVRAISVNPVDTKVRLGAAPPAGEWKVLGWDAVGRVAEVGEAVSAFKPGDEVYYAGSIARAGANSQFHLVDERIVGHKPASLSHAEAAALPLTAITAWEMLFDRLDIRKPVPGAANAVLIIGGAGGVGSIAIQLVRALTDVTVIATASRPETQSWVKELGAHHVVDHGKPLAEQVAALGIGAPAFVFSTTETHRHFKDIVELIAPQGRFGLIDDPDTLDIMSFKRKAVSTHWEFMFTRSLFQTGDMAEQGKLLDAVARLVDEGKIRTTVTEILRPINAGNLAKAHAWLESGKAKGKIVLEGF